ncbi:MAG TPA: cyclodeaminase/cyclohydrolase family protein [Candidatus Saccharimonadales bacterium]|nr:cyclodeaminase/cyclohydrolase family protein [Candidatus Saccharimonadales bacterium]
MRDESIAGFLDDLGAKRPTPGGGAVAALNGAVASAQLKMVCEYTKDKNIISNIDTLSQRVKTFLDLAEADAKAYAEVSSAYKTKDETKIEESLIKALNPSIDIIGVCEELISFCEVNYSKFNPLLKADLIVSLANLKASVRSSQAMITTNLDALAINPKNAEESRDYCYELLERVDKLYKKLGA